MLETLRPRWPRTRRKVPRVVGWLDSIIGSRLSGWAADRDALTRRQSVDVYVDGKLVRKAMANRVSPVAKAGER